MKKNLLFAMATALTVISTVTSAHDEGHGPKLSDTGKFGGLVSSVVKISDKKLGAKAPLVHKAELVRTSDGTVRVYFYDEALKPLDLKDFEKKASAVMGSKVKGKWKETKFEIELKDGSFTGKMPKVEGKPYDIDIHAKEGKTELLSAFDNLD